MADQRDVLFGGPCVGHENLDVGAYLAAAA